MDCKYTQVEKIHNGMQLKEVFQILPEVGWSEYNNGEYRYGWNYWAPDGSKRTFWIYVENGVITNNYSNQLYGTNY
jgi:hypothetical protein